MLMAAAWRAAEAEASAYHCTIVILYKQAKDFMSCNMKYFYKQ